MDAALKSRGLGAEPRHLAGDEGLISALADFAAGFALEQAPEVVRRQARLSVLDTIGCMVAAIDTPEARRLIACETEEQLRPGTASVVGLETKLSPQSAVRINAYLGDVFELNDLTGGHASIAVVPTALALAESRLSTGRALVEAVIVGMETTSRVYAAYYPTMKSYEETGIAPPGIPSTFGATAAASRLYGFNSAQTARALTIAGALAGWCPAEVIFGQGGTIKPMLFGAWPGSVALQAVVYAAAGFDGPAHLLESKIGLYATLSHSFDRSAIEAPTQWHLAQPRRKQHACCGYIHSAIDAVVELRHEGAPLAQAAMIEVGMPGYIIPGVSKSAFPRAPNEARFHAEYCIALAALDADVIRPDHSIDFATYLPLAESTMRRVQVVTDPALNHYHQCVVRGRDNEGTELFQRTITAPKGAPLNPMSDQDVRHKFAKLCSQRLEGHALQDYVNAIGLLEQATTTEWILRRFN